MECGWLNRVSGCSLGDAGGAKESRGATQRTQGRGGSAAKGLVLDLPMAWNGGDCLRGSGGGVDSEVLFGDRVVERGSSREGLSRIGSSRAGEARDRDRAVHG